MMITGLKKHNSHPVTQGIAIVLSFAVHAALLIPLLGNSEPTFEPPRTVVMVSLLDSQPVRQEAVKPVKQVRVAETIIEHDEPKPQLREEQVLSEDNELNPEALMDDSAQTLAQPDFLADYLQNPPPRYPSLSKRLKEQGEVLLRVRVGSEGEPVEVQLEQSSGYQRLDSAARDAVSRWRFVPAQRAGKPVMAWVLVPIEFSLES